MHKVAIATVYKDAAPAQLHDRQGLGHGESYLSASSLVIPKSSFLADFLFAATQDPGVRRSRLAILDRVEDKGVEP